MEFTGTYFLILTITTAAPVGGALAALAIGSSLMIMVYAGGHISGAHYNPAVSTAILFSRRNLLTVPDYCWYFLTQVIAGILAAQTGYFLTNLTVDLKPGDRFNPFQAFFAEVMYTFALAHVVLNTATTKANAGNSFYGLAIGFTVVVGAVAVGSVSGGCFNPAVGIGLHVSHAIFTKPDSLIYMWIYILAPLIGGALAAAWFRLTSHTEFDHTDEEPKEKIDDPEKEGLV